MNENDFKITDSEITNMQRISPSSMPLNPSVQGWSGQKVREYLSKYIFDVQNGLISVLNRKNQSIYDMLEDLDTRTNDEVIVDVQVNENIITFIKANGSEDEFEIGSGNATIYYDDTLPEDTTRLKNGDLWFDETE